MPWDYYYKNEASKYNFIRIPKALMTEEHFASLSLQAKILYGLLLDRMSEAIKNEWIDEKDQVYVIYPIADVMENMGVSKGKAIATMAELVTVGLIEKQQQGQGLPSRIYIKNFVIEEEM